MEFSLFCQTPLSRKYLLALFLKMLIAKWFINKWPHSIKSPLWELTINSPLYDVDVLLHGLHHWPKGDQVYDTHLLR